MAVGLTDVPLIAFHFQRARLVPEFWIPALFAGAMAVDAASALLLGLLYDRLGFRVLIVMFAIEAVTVHVLTLPVFIRANAVHR